ncbi:MAG: hypothetical protein D6795_16850 [Deltaproteobacteria bacterium]|nr:MAG: hypothetical protein D6795_16850 [Deltaproteobacteria bacterium]
MEKRTIRIILYILFITFVTLALGCGGDDKETTPAGSGEGNGEPNNASDLFSALVRGKRFDATGDNDWIVGSYENAALSLGAFDIEYGAQGAKIVLGLPGVQGPGTYTEETIVEAQLLFEEGTTIYAATREGSPRVTLTSLSETGAKGTFEFTGFNMNGTSVDVREGVFDVTF